MNRRKLLTSIVAGFSAVAAGGFAVPFLKSWFPTFRREISVDIDVSEMTPGQFRRIRWLGRTVYVINRDPNVETKLEQLDSNRVDPDSSRSAQPEFAANRIRARAPEHLLVFANCTHLGCEVEVIDQDGFAGFRCPCHRSDFDAAGRVQQGFPAKLNLEVPDYDYAGEGIIRLIDVEV